MEDDGRSCGSVGMEMSRMSPGTWSELGKGKRAMGYMDQGSGRTEGHKCFEKLLLVDFGGEATDIDGRLLRRAGHCSIHGVHSRSREKSKSS